MIDLVLFLVAWAWRYIIAPEPYFPPSRTAIVVPYGQGYELRFRRKPVEGDLRR